MASFPLNPAQRQAVEHMGGPMLVLAGAGSGKTRVITQRIARLVERGVAARSIVALTFTNKAAGEMAERVAHVMKQAGDPRSAKQLTICTFHSFGLQVLQRERAAMGGTFTIFDQGDCLAAIKDILGRIDAGRRFDASAVMARISNAKNAFLSPEAFTPREGDAYDDIAKLVYPRYEAALRNFRAYDFDDLVCGVARLWSTRQDILDKWRERFRYILVDEYQDTNRSQMQLLRQLVEPHRNICVVGDDDQSIYAWRGADVRNILEFEEHFPGAVVVKLEQNYRSCKPVLDVANAVIGKRVDGSRHRKVLFTDRPGGEKVLLGAAPTPEAEAAYVSREIGRMIREDKRRPRDFAVLYRSNSQSAAIEAALRENGVAHKVVGGQQFFERKEVKDVLAYLKVALNRADEIALRRILNYPPRGIGETSVERLGLHATAKGWSLWEAVERVDALDDIASSAREGCRGLENAIGELRKMLLIERMPASIAARAFAEKIGLKAELDGSSGSPQAAARRWSNVEALLRTFAKREARETAKGNDATQEQALAAFLHALTLTFSEEEEAAADVVILSTLHGAKGLEFDVVFFMGCEEGLLPHARTLDAKATDAKPVDTSEGGANDIEEERRLFYVGVTRAKQRLVLLRCKARVLRGKPMARTPSRFLLDIPDDLVTKFEIVESNPMDAAAVNASANALLAALDALG
jgi:ATP-dependent DNA helicase Rep